MKCYHTTKIENLQSIKDEGLVPVIGKNSQQINDCKKKVFFSQGEIGAIGLASEFSRKFKEYKEKGKLKEYSSLEDYLGNSVLLTFDLPLEVNENKNNYIDGYSSNKINSKNISMLNLTNKETNKTVNSWNDIIYYMMSKFSIEEFKSNELDKKTLNYLKQFYSDNEKEIEKYKNGNYLLETKKINEIDLEKIKFTKFNEQDKFISDLKETVVNKNDIESISSCKLDSEKEMEIEK